MYVIVMRVCDVYFTTERKWFTADYLCVLLVGNGVKHRL
jgi:hypothetical protein